MRNETLIDKAEQNLHCAAALKEAFSSDDSYLNYIAYHIQQAVELTIKYILENNGVIYPKTHAIDQLIIIMKDNQLGDMITEYIFAF